MSYNLTNLTNSNTLLDMAVYVNTVTDGWAGAGLLTTIFVFIFIGLLPRNDTVESLSFAALTCSIISIFFYAIGLAGSVTLTYFLIGGALSIVGLVFSQRSGGT